MPDKLIKRFEKAGKIRKQKAGIVQIKALLREAVLDLEEAKRIVNVYESIVRMKIGRLNSKFKGWYLILTSIISY